MKNINLAYKKLSDYDSNVSAHYLISRNGIIILDEYGKRGWGETDAVDEFLENHKELEIKTIEYSNQPTAYIVKKL